MNNRTRVITALNHKQPDKVPYYMWLTQPAKVKLSAFYGDSDFVDKLGLCFTDVGHYENNYRPVGQDIWEDSFGVRWDRTMDRDLGTVCNCLVDSETISKYIFPDPKVCLAETFGNQIVPANTEQFVILQLGFSLFERAWTFAGMESVLSAMADDESFADCLMEKILEFNLAWIDLTCALPIDAILFGDDWGQQNGLIMGPKLWRRFIKPHLAAMCRAVKAKDKYVFLHSCGKVDDIFPDLIECGVDLFNPFQPEVIDVYEIKKRYGQSLSFFGGISIQRTLPFGTIDQTRQEVRQLLEKIGDQGGYVAAWHMRFRRMPRWKM